MMQLVTASETAVFRSATSSSVGLSCVQKDAAVTLASPSFTGIRTGKRNLFYSINQNVQLVIALLTEYCTV